MFEEKNLKDFQKEKESQKKRNITIFAQIFLFLSVFALVIFSLTTTNTGFLENFLVSGNNPSSGGNSYNLPIIIGNEEKTLSGQVYCQDGNGPKYPLAGGKIMLNKWNPIKNTASISSTYSVSNTGSFLFGKDSFSDVSDLKSLGFSLYLDANERSSFTNDQIDVTKLSWSPKIIPSLANNKNGENGGCYGWVQSDGITGGYGNCTYTNDAPKTSYDFIMANCVLKNTATTTPVPPTPTQKPITNNPEPIEGISTPVLEKDPIDKDIIIDPNPSQPIEVPITPILEIKQGPSLMASAKKDPLTSKVTVVVTNNGTVDVEYINVFGSTIDTPKTNTRIWNGYYAPSFPSWAVSTGPCTGILIDPEWVLSAAHCNPLYANTLVIGGDYDVGGMIDNPTGEYRTTVKAIIGNIYENLQLGDWELLKLDKPSTKTPIQIGTKEQLDGYRANMSTSRAYGWGSRIPVGGSYGSIDISRPDTTDNNHRFRTVKMLMIPKDSKDSAFRIYPGWNVLHTMGADTNSGTSTGDSGGPLIKNGVLYGVLSGALMDKAMYADITSDDFKKFLSDNGVTLKEYQRDMLRSKESRTFTIDITPEHKRIVVRATAILGDENISRVETIIPESDIITTSQQITSLRKKVEPTPIVLVAPTSVLISNKPVCPTNQSKYISRISWSGGQNADMYAIRVWDTAKPFSCGQGVDCTKSSTIGNGFLDYEFKSDVNYSVWIEAWNSSRTNYVSSPSTDLSCRKQ